MGEGEGGMIWETNIETCILPYVKEMTSASLMHEAGHSKLVLWDNSEVWGWQGGGRGVQDGGNTCAPVANSCQCMAKLSQYCKIIILLLKLIKKKKTIWQCRRHKRQGFNSWVWKIPGRRTWNPLQYSCLENPMDRGAWKATVRGVTKSRTQPSN